MNPDVALLQQDTVNHALDLLNQRERRYVLQVTIGRMSQSRAANDAGFKSPPKSMPVRHALNVINTEIAKKLDISLDYIQKGMLEAVQMARSNGEPMVMIAGYREMGKLAGMYIEKKEIEVKIRHLTEEQLQELTNEELDSLIEDADSIELTKNERGEFELEGDAG
jgi:histidyl-tRNA synthetase